MDELSGFGRPNYDLDVARQVWDDADRYVDSLLARIGTVGQNKTMCSQAYTCGTEGQLMDEYGFIINAGSRAEKGLTQFGHTIWNPWRPATNDDPGHEIEEDLNTSYIMLDHFAQVGVMGGAHGTLLSVPHLKRYFLMLYLEWLSRERSGTLDKVWTFGFVFHPEDGDTFNDALAEFLDWLDDNFIRKVSPHGNIIARYATINEIADEYTAWEVAHPDTSSFNWIEGDGYPYTYDIVPKMLAEAEYDSQIDIGESLSCYKLSKKGQPIYLMWSDKGERTVDFSGEMSGIVSVTEITGAQSTQSAAALTLKEDPLFVEAQPTHEDSRSGETHDFMLHPNYPNPFNPSTTITFDLPIHCHVKLSIFNALGKEIDILSSRKFSAGRHSLQWNASLMPSGVYMYKLEAGGFVQIRKLILLK
jgi:hypothetical protein